MLSRSSTALCSRFVSRPASFQSVSSLTSRCAAASSQALSGLTTSPETTAAAGRTVTMTHQSSASNSHKRYFSTVQTELSDILTRELAEEEANGSSTMPEDLAELKAQIEESWRVVDGGVSGDGSGVVRLFKKEPLEGSGAKVAIAFHCQDTIPSEDKESGGSLFDQMTEGGDEEEEEDAVAVRFTVMISRAGKTMVYTCLSEDAVTNVERVAVVDGDDIEDLIANGVDEKAYQGPEFTELAEDLQGSLCEFIDDVAGVDTDVASFIAMYADYKEQTEYVEWLRKVKSMV